MTEAAKSAAVAQTPLNLEMAAVTMTSRLRSDADNIAARLKILCPENSRLRTAVEMRAVARSLVLAAEHIVGNAETLEVSHGR